MLMMKRQTMSIFLGSKLKVAFVNVEVLTQFTPPSIHTYTTKSIGLSLSVWINYIT
ncbi:hypothetical protein FHK02_357 [Spirosoma sp. LMG 31448]|uniref:Uncharacterized protein n=1 Tax=Spirosoma utsteinense TaxID=2585773 RepID=A0ABR6W7M7_9BACT|nr:hypothetical protein [Spirosoma utsteinense]MBC3792586.1 hypothetical protein [Spirosoma utsteinense]